MENYAHFKEMANKALQQISLNKEPSGLYAPISYILELGGKRLRPVLTLAACDLFGENPKNALAAATGIEIFHNFTLLHDDIMDKADMRRGKETVHKKWNSNVAILSGDTMFALAYKQIFSAHSQRFAQILETFTQTAIDVCEGQQYDMDFETSDKVSIPEYLKMIRLKTAVLLGCSLKVGALTANAELDQAEKLYDFGINIGLAFQLKDDYLDAFGDFSKFGKSIGGDIVANKKTYLYLKCLELCDKKDRIELTSLYEESNLDRDHKIDQVLKLYNKYDIKKYTSLEMEKYYNHSLEVMKSIEAASDKKNMLSAYAEWLYQRDY